MSGREKRGPKGGMTILGDSHSGSAAPRKHQLSEPQRSSAPLWQQSLIHLAKNSGNIQEVTKRLLATQATGDLMEFTTRLPGNVATPVEAEDLNHSRIEVLGAGTSNNLMYEFKAPSGSFVYYTGYVIFTDALDANLIEFKPTINNNRTLRYHGDPLVAGSKLDTSLAPDLGNNSLINCWLILKPGETFRWKVDNLQAVDAPFGIRMVGFVDSRTPKRNNFFGG